MLVLSRKTGEEIVIANQVRLRVLEVRGKRVTLGISAPKSIAIYRDELPRRGVDYSVVAETAIRTAPSDSTQVPIASEQA